MSGEAVPLELKDVTSGYGDVAVIRRVSMTFRKGVITTIVGSNGAGKSTAIKAAAGLLRAWQGSIRFTAPTSPASLPTGGSIAASPMCRRAASSSRK